MARTPLFAMLRRAVALAAPRGPRDAPLDERADPAFGRPTRRGVLVWAAAAAALTTLPLPLRQALAQSSARIVVVGAGLAGLVAAHRLVEGGARSLRVYEAANRVGGRMFSGRDAVAPGHVAELGGSFINSGHRDMLALCREFRLPLEDSEEGEAATLRTAYFVGGRHRGFTEIAEAARDLAARIARIRRLPEAGRRAFDSRPAAALLDEWGVSGWLRTLLDIGLTQEMGLEPDRMSGLYLTETFAVDAAKPGEGMFSSDQRYQIAGGNDRLPAAIAARLGERVVRGHRLEAIAPRGRGFVLSFAREGGAAEVEADLVILALPPTVLREVEIRLELPEKTRRAIGEITFGTNAKLFAGLSRRPWRAQGFSGELLTDLGFQTCWEDHARPGGGPGGLTVFAGGRTGVEFARGAAADRTREVLQRLEAAFPEASAAGTGTAARMDWPGNALARGSYSCFAPGQFTAFAGAFAPVGRLLFAGEHMSEDHSGYMNGAAETGRLAARAAARLLR
ncbi:MAG: FAD-dependent oxidoreductase [Acetobacteraceae bacterium]|nr:FAD-dependent oxidoreductase [Acetobacteraceae bacterium]